MITINDVSYSVKGKTLVEHVSAVFAAGKINLVIGPNGAGKSTLIKLISGQLTAQSGAVLLGDKNIHTVSVPQLARVRAVLSQNTELAFPLTAQEVVMMGRYPHFTGTAQKRDKEACREAMRFFDVEKMAERNYLTLSGGERQRVQFARVLTQLWYPVAGSCRYLILDEPLTFLDIYYQYDFMNKLVSLSAQQDMVIVGVVHDLNLAAKYADYLLLLNQGKVLASGDKHEVLTSANIKAAYHLEPTIRNENGELHLLF
jgi:iron complex transport system ATP-binding protein